MTSERGSGLISTLINEIKQKRACTDSQNYQILNSIKKSNPKLKPNPQPFYDTRIIKDEQEISILKKLQKIIDEMFELCTKKMRNGQKESDYKVF